MTIAPFLLGLAIFFSIFTLAAKGDEGVRRRVALLATVLAITSVVAACIPGGL